MSEEDRDWDARRITDSLREELDHINRILKMPPEELAKERWLEMVKGIDNHCLWEHENEKFKTDEIFLAREYLDAINRKVKEGCPA